jgi:two-component system chemotaxis sensor kinase CheA
MTKDPYRYFRIEAQELIEGLTQGLLELEKVRDKELVRRLLRQAHTFKGASRVVRRSDLGDLAHELEDILSAHREDGGPAGPETVSRSLALLDQIRRLVASLTVETEQQAPRKRSQPILITEGEEAIRVTVHDLDVLLETAFEAYTVASELGRETAQLTALQIQAQNLSASLHTSPFASDLDQFGDRLNRVHRTLRERIERVMVELGELRVLTSDLRLVPAQTLMTELERAIRDAAQTLDKVVEFRATGAQTHIDAHVLAGLHKALVHVVRNSVAHGIEDRAGRRAAGKPLTGRVDISIERRGHRVSISCRDDGRGLDLEAVRNAAIASGLVTRDAALSLDESALGQLLLQGGVTTSRTITGISGRGVGLEAVRHTVEALKGEVSLRSLAGEGTTVDISVPLSLSAMPVLSVQVDDSAVLIPLDSVRQTLRVRPQDISHDIDGERLVVDGTVVPFLSLRRVLIRGNHHRPEMQSSVVIEAQGRLAALGVDHIGAVHSVVVRGIPEHAAPDPVISGAAFDDNGQLQLVVAPPALVRAAADPVPPREEMQMPSTPRMLVIDDSLTTRMLEQSILESAGYEVDLAVSGEEALEKAQRQRYGVFIVDVEMPGMNGFEFIARTRSDPVLRDTPAILVTSRTDPQDKRRGKEVGARAYIVKTEFDQAELLDAIRRLVT